MNNILVIVFSLVVILSYCLRYKKISAILAVGFLLRLGMALLYTHYGDPDPDGYGLKAISMIGNNIFDTVKNFEFGAYTYSWFVAIVYDLIGVSEVAIRILNALISSLVIVYTYRITNSLFGSKENAPFYSAMTIALFPILIRFSSSFASRESLIVFMTMIALDKLTTFYKTNKPRYLFETIVFSLIATALHISMLFLFCGIFYVFFHWSKKKTNNFNENLLKKIIWLSMSIFLMVLIIVLLNNGLGSSKLALGQGDTPIERVASLQESSAIGRANYLTGITSTNPIVLILLSPLRVVYFLFSPFIWMIRTPIDILGFIDGLMYLILVISVVKIIRDNKHIVKSNRVIYYSLIVVTILITLSFALITSNYGTAMRHRAKVIPIIVVLSAPKIKNIFRIKKRNKVLLKKW